jgi:hypothetical protein
MLPASFGRVGEQQYAVDEARVAGEGGAQAAHGEVVDDQDP